MQAITVKTLAATDLRGRRVKAECRARTRTLAWDHSLDVEQNHAAAARGLLELVDWPGQWTPGVLSDGRTVYVRVDPERSIRRPRSCPQCGREAPQDATFCNACTPPSLRGSSS